MAELTSEHKVVLMALAYAHSEGSDHPYLSFGSIAARTFGSIDPRKIRRVTRHLARKGLAQFANGLWTDEGEPAGSGYAITDAGRAALAKEQTS